MQHPLACKNCDRATMTAESVSELEYTCPWCYRVTVFNIHGNKVSATLTRGESPDQLKGERKTEAFAKMMRTNRGVDAHRC